MYGAILKRIWGNQQGWAFVAYKGKSTDFKQQAFQYPAHFDKLLAFVEEKKAWANVWFCPHLFTEPRRQKDYKICQPITALWIDQDKGDAENLQPKPTICWSTSTGRQQAVWILKEQVDPAAAEKVNQYLTYLNKGDKGGWHIGKVIRVPNTTNFKYDPPKEGVLLWDDGPTYSFTDLQPTSEHLQSFLAS